jgi:hypothetical protein
MRGARADRCHCRGKCPRRSRCHRSLLYKLMGRFVVSVTDGYHSMNQQITARDICGKMSSLVGCLSVMNLEQVPPLLKEGVKTVDR